MASLIFKKILHFTIFSLFIILSLTLPIQEINQLPSSIILAPDEHARFYTEDYFSGFNLTFKGIGRSEKLTEIASFDLKKFNEATPTKILQTLTGTMIAFLNEDLSIQVIKYSNKTFSSLFSAPIDNAKKCYDLEFLDEETIVVDCNMVENGKAFSFISISKARVFKVTYNDEKFKKHSSRWLKASQGFNGSHLISYITSKDTSDLSWQIIYIKFTEEYGIDNLLKVTESDFEEITSGLSLYDILALDSENMILGLDEDIYLISADNLGKVNKYPLDEAVSYFTQLYETKVLASTLVIAGSSAYEVLQSKEEGFLDVSDLFIDSAYRIEETVDEKFLKIQHALLTKDFVILITEGVESLVYIYQRGNPNRREAFYFNFISPGKFPFAQPQQIFSYPDQNIIFWMTSGTVHVILIQEIWVELVNNRPGLSADRSVEVCSENDCIVKNVQTVFLTENDVSIYQYGSKDLKFVQAGDDQVNIIFDDFFLAPHLDYFVVIDEEQILTTAYTHARVSIGSMPFSFMTIDYDVLHNKFRVYHQSSKEATLDLYLCNLLSDGNGLMLDCDKKKSALAAGNVKKVYTNNLMFDIIESSNENGKRILSMTTKKLSSTLTQLSLSQNNCETVYQSFDNLLESNLYCGYQDQLNIFNNYSSTTSQIQLKFGFTIKKMLTHPSFPGLLFVSNQSHIMILWSDFYLGSQPEISTINMFEVPESPDFTFVVTSSHLVIFMPKNNTISEFDIRNPQDIVFNKHYMLYESEIVIQENTLAYSHSSDLVYFLAKSNGYYIIALEPNAFGNGNIKYIFSAGEGSDVSSFIMSVSFYEPGVDFVLYGFPGSVQGTIINREAKITINNSYEPNRELFLEKSLKLVAKQPYTFDLSNLTATLYVVNTHRDIKPLKSDSDIVMNLSYRNTTTIAFKEGEFFYGPAFHLDISKEYGDDNIVFIPRVNRIDFPDESILPRSVADITYKKGRLTKGTLLVLEEETSRICMYDSTTFPSSESKRDVIYAHNFGRNPDARECYQIEMDAMEQYMGVLCYDFEERASFIDIMSMQDISLNFQLVTPTEDTDALYKLISNYLFYTTRYGYYALYIFKITQEDGGLDVKLIAIVTRDQLDIRKGDQITDLDGFEIMKDHLGVLIITGATGINYISIKNNIVKASSYPNFVELFSEDHLNGYNNVPIFNALSLINFYQIEPHRSETESTRMSIIFVISSKNAFSYRLNLTADSEGNIQNMMVLEGYIQYEGYTWLETIVSSADIVVLVGETKLEENPEKKLIHYFFYDRRSITGLGESYPLYDAFQTITQKAYESFKKPAMLLIKKREGEFIYLPNTIRIPGISRSLLGYAINDVFRIETNASRVTSTYVDLIGENDLSMSVIKIQIQNYGNITTGQNPGIIILIVFGSLCLIFIIVAVLIKVFSNKEKKNLKDTFPSQESDETQTAEQNSSEYIKMEN